MLLLLLHVGSLLIRVKKKFGLYLKINTRKI